MASRPTARWRPLLLLLLALAWVPPLRADGIDDELLALQRDWEVVRYQTPALERPRRWETLAARAEALAEANPGRAEPLVWQGAILSAWAEDRGGITAWRLTRRAKALYESAIRIDPRALDGTALVELGRLYAHAPGWPFGFGDRDKARALLREALEVDPDGIDSNTCYGEFLVESGQRDEAMPYLRKALARAPRAGRLVGDLGRRAQARALVDRLAAAR